MKLKHNHSNQIKNTESLPPILDTLRQQYQGVKVPEGYFDSLSPHISERIKKQENRSIKVWLPIVRKPMVWAPVMATALVAVLLLFISPVKKETPVVPVDEWTELNMAYDASYAGEALLNESSMIDSEVDNSDVGYIQSASFTGENEPTDEEIASYLKEQDIDPETINEY